MYYVTIICTALLSSAFATDCIVDGGCNGWNFAGMIQSRKTECKDGDTITSYYNSSDCSTTSLGETSDLGCVACPAYVQYTSKTYDESEECTGNVIATFIAAVGVGVCQDGEIYSCTSSTMTRTHYSSLDCTGEPYFATTEISTECKKESGSGSIPTAPNMSSNILISECVDTTSLPQSTTTTSGPITSSSGANYPSSTSPGSICNSVEILYGSGSAGEEEAFLSSLKEIPTNVCMTEEYGAYKLSSQYVCDNGVVRKQVFENSADCGGYPSSIEDAACYGNDEFDSCSSQSFCDLLPCTYAAVDWWSGVSQCGGGPPAAFLGHRNDAIVTDACETMTLEDGTTVSAQFSCVSDAMNGDSIIIEYWLAHDCSGPSIYNDTIFETACNAADGSQSMVQCDQIAPETPPLPQSTTTTSGPITSSSGTTRPRSTCNSVELDDPNDPSTPPIEIPTNVCARLERNGIVESRQFVCVNGVAIMEVYENSADCSGAPTSIQDPCYDVNAFGWSDLGFDGCVSESFCDLAPCTYAAVEYWEEVSGCSHDFPAPLTVSSYTNRKTIPFVTGACETITHGDTHISAQFLCEPTMNGDSLSVEFWVHETECSGPMRMAEPIFATGCGPDRTAATVRCNQVAPGAPKPPQPPITSSSPPPPRRSCDALDIDYFLDSCSSLWDPLPDISKSNFNRHASCPAVAIDDFLGECSDRWQSATQTIQDNAETLRKLSHFQATSCESLEINEFLRECSDIYDYIDARFAALSHPEAKAAPVYDAKAVGGSVDTAGVVNTFLGIHTHLVLLVSVITNVVLVCVGCFMMNTLRKVQKFKSYQHPVAMFEDEESED